MSKFKVHLDTVKQSMEDHYGPPNRLESTKEQSGQQEIEYEVVHHIQGQQY